MLNKLVLAIGDYLPISIGGLEISIGGFHVRLL